MPKSGVPAFARKSERSPYFAKPKRERPVPKWKIAALAAAGERRQPWESAAAFARRLATTNRVARRAPPSEGSAAAALFAPPRSGSVTLANVRPLPDKHIAFIGVYLLRSVQFPSRCYVGYTHQVDTRLRQHNGLLAGGAKYTERGRPWRIIAYVHGFRSKIAGLRLEAALTHHAWSKHARPLLAHPVMRAVPDGLVGLKARLMQLLMCAPEFCEEPLRITWRCAEARERHEIEFGDGAE